MRRGMLMMKVTGPIVIATVAVGLATGVHFSERRALDTALADHRRRSQAELVNVAAHIDESLRSIYEGIRTTARLPGVRAIDRYAHNFDDDARRTVQEIYNNLASSFTLSELYIVPIDMEPDEIDPSTGELQEPITTFDELIVERHADQHGDASERSSDLEEIEIFEYRLMKRQMAWFRAHCPTESSVRGLQYPVLSGPEVVTCDNTRYSPSHPDDKDRSGMVYSVPLFAPDGSLKGCVSAVVLTGAIQELLPTGEYAVRAAGHGYTAMGPGDGPARAHQSEIERGVPAADLLCSLTTDLKFADAESRWMLWRARPDSAFEGLPEVAAARRVATISYAGVGVLGVSGLILVLMLASHVDLVRHQRDTLEAEVGQRTRELREMALTDRLTGLPNRALITDRIERTIARASRAGEARYAVLFLDFDRFKLINDTLGHEAGDRLLVGIAERLRATLRITDSIARIDAGGHTAARLGGDEFVLLLEDLTRPEDADAVAERLVGVMSAPYDIAGQQVVSTASIGVVRGDRRYERAADLLRDADTAMYEAKAAGKGRYVVFDAAMRERIVRRGTLDRDVRDAAARNELFLQYQPVVRLIDGKIESVEALVRWNHPEHGLVSPAEFIPIAEESSAIARITDWVVRAACAQVVQWRSALGSDKTPGVAINISRSQLGVQDLPEQLASIVREAGLEPGAFSLEITETAITRDQKSAVAALKRLKAAGFRLALDDFGTGYSSLSTLHQFPLDTVKLDRSFIGTSGMGHGHAALVHAVVSLANNLGMSVIAEGVETTDQLAALQTLDCQYAQGYLFGRAVPPERIAELMLGRRLVA